MRVPMRIDVRHPHPRLLERFELRGALRFRLVDVERAREGAAGQRRQRV